MYKCENLRTISTESMYNQTGSASDRGSKGGNCGEPDLPCKMTSSLRFSIAEAWISYIVPHRQKNNVKCMQLTARRHPRAREAHLQRNCWFVAAIFSSFVHGPFACSTMHRFDLATEATGKTRSATSATGETHLKDLRDGVKNKIKVTLQNQLCHHDSKTGPGCNKAVMLCHNECHRPPIGGARPLRGGAVRGPR